MGEGDRELGEARSRDDMTMTETMTLIEKTVFLKFVDLLADIPTEALAQVAARATEVRCERGRALFSEGDEDQGTFIVIEGSIELRKAGSVVRLLRAGMALGELFLGENEPHQYTAIALEDTHLLNLRRADVVDALLEYPEFGLAMVQDLALRLHKLTQRVIELEAETKRGEARPDGAQPEAIEPAEPQPAVPKRRGWWRLGGSRQRPK